MKGRVLSFDFTPVLESLVEITPQLEIATGQTGS